MRQTSGAFSDLTNRGGVSKEWVMFETHVQPWDRNINIEQTDEESRNLTSVTKRIAHMDELKIDVQVLYPTIFL